MGKNIAILTAAVCAMLTNGCVALGLGAAAGAGYLAHDEATENDGRFDPLEDVRDKEDGRN
jgi:hypothetical protein